MKKIEGIAFLNDPAVMFSVDFSLEVEYNNREVKDRDE